MNYTKEQIDAALALLNGIDIKGIENAKRITMINMILNSPEEDQKDGSKDEKVCQHDS